MCLCLSVPAAAVVKIYVSPVGDDANPGTLTAPLKTLGMVQWRLQHMTFTDNVEVILYGGTYPLTQPFTLTTADCVHGPINFHAYSSEKPIISGGKRLLNWSSTVTPDGTLWTCQTTKSFRDLYLNNLRLTRARWPNQSSVFSSCQIVGDPISNPDWYIVHVSPPLPVLDFVATDQAELVVKTGFQAPRQRIDHTVATKSGTDVYFPSAHPIGRPDRFNMSVANGNLAYFEGPPSLLDVQFEWSEYPIDDATNAVYVLLPNGFDLNGADEVIYPVAQQLVILEEGVHEITFQNLNFAFTNHPLPETGYAAFQACHEVDTRVNQMEGAIDCRGVTRCVIDHCRIAHTGASGIALYGLDPGDPTAFNIVFGCEVFDVGGHGVYIGYPGHTNVYWTYQNRVTRCWIHDYGRDYQDAIGVWGGKGIFTQIQYSSITDGAYTGISVGWLFGHQQEPDEQHPAGVDFAMQSTYIGHNEIARVLQTMSFGGGIYTLGSQPKFGNPVDYSLIDSNWVHDIPLDNGIYFDEGSDRFLVWRNVVEHTNRPIGFNTLYRADLGEGPQTPAHWCGGNPTNAVSWTDDCQHFWYGEFWTSLGAYVLNYFDRDPRTGAICQGSLQIPNQSVWYPQTSGDPWPAEAQATIDGAGPGPGFEYLHDPYPQNPLREH